jgi:[ribosomal protein S5]-alanine N-acetyltransferase
MTEPVFTPFPQLTTQRLCLRCMSPADAPAVFDMRSSPAVMQYIDRPLAVTVAEAEMLVQNILLGIEQNESITWAIALAENPALLIGSIGFWRMEKEHYRAEIGYMLHPAYWSKGYVTEAIDAVLKYGFEQMGLHSVEANINPENRASAVVLEKTGFVQEAYFKENFYYNGRFLDTIVYSKLTSKKAPEQ